MKVAKRGSVVIEGIGQVTLRLCPTEEELVQAERAKRARGFFLGLVEALLIEPPYDREQWVRLPEEELREIALLIAEANDLLLLFRPKKEKPFYNAFRNAWRMKRARHNEAVFQRAIGEWRAHIEKALSAAAKAYREAVGKKYETVVGHLARAGFVLSPTVLAEVADKMPCLDAEEIETTLQVFWTDEALAKLVEGWFDLDPFRRREEIIRSAFAAFGRGEYPLVIYGLLPQPEGVLWDFLVQHNPIEEQLEELIGTQKRTFVTVEALIREVFRDLLGEEEIPFYRFFKFVEFADDGSLNRHAVEHGVSIRFGTRQNALRLLLLLDFTHFVLGQLLGHQSA